MASICMGPRCSASGQPTGTGRLALLNARCPQRARAAAAIPIGSGPPGAVIRSCPRTTKWQGTASSWIRPTRVST
eukprot:7729476-Pyramimonas_sp.AAC.1